jgi:hypothetical protein
MRFRISPTVESVRSGRDTKRHVPRSYTQTNGNAARGDATGMMKRRRGIVITGIDGAADRCGQSRQSRDSLPSRNSPPYEERTTRGICAMNTSEGRQVQSRLTMPRRTKRQQTKTSFASLASDGIESTRVMKLPRN